MNGDHEHCCVVLACCVDLSRGIKNMDSKTLCGTILSCRSVKACGFSESAYFKQQCMSITNKNECYFIIIPHNVIKATQRLWMPLKRLKILPLIEITMSSWWQMQRVYTFYTELYSFFWVVFYSSCDFSNISYWNISNAYDLVNTFIYK